jgi:hypothetical protein
LRVLSVTALFNAGDVASFRHEGIVLPDVWADRANAEVGQVRDVVQGAVSQESVTSGVSAARIKGYPGYVPICLIALNEIPAAEGVQQNSIYAIRIGPVAADHVIARTE